MAFEEFKEISKSDETKELEKQILENSIAVLSGDLYARKKLMQLLVDIPFSLREQFYWNKFCKFLDGVYLLPGDEIKLSNKLFGNEADKKRNGMRLFEYIEKVDTEECLQFMINATRSLLLGLISASDYFRIVKALTETLYEDLIFLSEHITEGKRVRGNTQILALARSGLMIDAGIDANADAENQEYVFTSFGRLVDQFAISFENEERRKWYKNKTKSTVRYDTGVEDIKEEDIDNLSW